MLSKLIAASAIVAGADALRVESFSLSSALSSAKNALGASDDDSDDTSDDASSDGNSISGALGTISNALQSNTTTSSTTNTTTSTGATLADTQAICEQVESPYKTYQGLSAQIQATVKAQLGESLPKLLNLYSKYCEKGGSSEGQPLTAKDKQDLTTAGQDIEDKLGQTGQSQIATQLLGNFGLR